MKQIHIVCENQGKEVGRFNLVMQEDATTLDVLTQVYLQHPYLKSNEDARIYVDGQPIGRKLMGQTTIKVD